MTLLLQKGLSILLGGQGSATGQGSTTGETETTRESIVYAYGRHSEMTRELVDTFEKLRTGHMSRFRSQADGASTTANYVLPGHGHGNHGNRGNRDRDRGHGHGNHGNRGNHSRGRGDGVVVADETTALHVTETTAPGVAETEGAHPTTHTFLVQLLFASNPRYTLLPPRDLAAVIHSTIQSMEEMISQDRMRVATQYVDLLRSQMQKPRQEKESECTLSSAKVFLADQKTAVGFLEELMDSLQDVRRALRDPTLHDAVAHFVATHFGICVVATRNGRVTCFGNGSGRYCGDGARDPRYYGGGDGILGVELHWSDTDSGYTTVSSGSALPEPLGVLCRRLLAQRLDAECPSWRRHCGPPDGIVTHGNGGLVVTCRLGSGSGISSEDNASIVVTAAKAELVEFLVSTKAHLKKEDLFRIARESACFLHMHQPDTRMQQKRDVALLMANILLDTTAN